MNFTKHRVFVHCQVSRGVICFSIFIANDKVVDQLLTPLSPIHTTTFFSFLFVLNIEQNIICQIQIRSSLSTTYPVFYKMNKLVNAWNVSHQIKSIILISVVSHGHYFFTTVIISFVLHPLSAPSCEVKPEIKLNNKTVEIFLFHPGISQKLDGMLEGRDFPGKSQESSQLFLNLNKILEIKIIYRDLCYNNLQKHYILELYIFQKFFTLVLLQHLSYKTIYEQVR